MFHGTRDILAIAVSDTEHGLVDAAPLERVKTVPLRRLLDQGSGLTVLRTRPWRWRPGRPSSSWASPTPSGTNSTGSPTRR